MHAAGRGLDRDDLSFLARPLRRSVSGIFVVQILEDFAGDFLQDFSGHFPHKNEEKKSSDKICEKIQQSKSKNPRKICPAKNRPLVIFASPFFTVFGGPKLPRRGAKPA